MTGEGGAKYDGGMAAKPKKPELPPEVKAMFARWGAEGGRATGRRRTAAERKAAAVKAIKTRWKRYRENQAKA